MTPVHTETIDGITYTIYTTIDDTPVAGNALVSGDEAEDIAAENAILKRLTYGDRWAWAFVEVKAETTINGEKFTGSDYLGSCSYQDTNEFIRDDYYDGMKIAAKADMVNAMRSAVNRGDLAFAYLAARGL